MPVKKAASTFLAPLDGKEIRPVLDYVIKNGRPGDSLYLYCGAIHAFDFYHSNNSRYSFNNFITINGVTRAMDPAAYRADLLKLAGRPRVWVVMSHTRNPEKGVDEEAAFLSILDGMGECRDQIKVGKASAWLYNLSSSE